MEGEQGVNWKIISERLGQGSVAMTLDLYAHASPGMQQAAALGFDKVLEKVGDAREPGHVRVAYKEVWEFSALAKC